MPGRTANFCDIFGMEVNTTVDKTSAVAFRSPRTGLPRGALLRYKGVDLPFQDTYKHLGVVLHATRGMVVAADALAKSGDRAMRALQSACRQQHITQFDMKCRLFDALVEPVLSYASHVWGPELFSSGTPLSKQHNNGAEKVHISYLRMLAGVGKRTCTDVIMRDFCRRPVMHHWVVLAARWFAKLASMPQDKLARHAWLADIDLMLAGCTKCWTHQLLRTLTSLQVLQRPAWDKRTDASLTSADIQRICVCETAVRESLVRLTQSRWDGGHDDPRSAPSVGIEKCTHAAWVHPVVAGSVCRPKHLHLCLSFKMLQCLARFRLGWHHLQVQVGRHQRPQVARADRLCRLCSVGLAPQYGDQGDGQQHVEDLMHFMLECPAYTTIRSKFPVFFAHTRVRADPNAHMRAIFDSDQQEQLAFCIYSMNSHRSECLNPAPRSPDPPVDVELLRIM